MTTARNRTATGTSGALPSLAIDNGGDRLLALLQVTNAAFPTGAFTHSLGLETWIADGRVADAAAVEATASDWLRFNLATGDAVAATLAFRAAQFDRFDDLAAIDQALGAIKLSREGRSASVMTGAALIAAGRDIFGLSGLKQLEAMKKEGRCDGHHAVAYGVLSAGLRFTEQDTVSTYLWSSLSSLVGVAQRLVPLGQADAQRIISRAGPLIEACAEIARMRDLDTMSTSFAGLDVASMQHERLPTRLCIS